VCSAVASGSAVGELLCAFVRLLLLLLLLQSMLEAKQKAEAALNKLHQRMSSKKAAQSNSNPFLEPPVVQQLHLVQPPTQLVSAAAGPSAAATPAAAGAGGVGEGGSSAADHLPQSPSRAIEDPPGATTAAEQAMSGAVQVEQPLTAGAEAVAAAAAASAAAVSGLKRQLQQLNAEKDEDVLFETAAVLRAFSSILPSELLAVVTGSRSSMQQEQQKADGGGVEEEAMEVDVMDGGAATAQQTLVAAVGPQGYGAVGWRPTEEVAAPVPAAAGVVGGNSIELLCSGIDPLVSGKRALFTLSSSQRPADVYAERLQMKGAASGRQRKGSRFDADPKMVQAKGILEAGPEAVFAAAGTGGSSLHELFDVEDGFDG
jgi:hypothetical protein